MEKKNLVMVVLCVAIGVMAIAYAAFTTQLDINGNIQATGNFEVGFSGNGTCTALEQIGLDTPTGTATAAAKSTTATLNVKLYTPGDVVQCTIPVANTGNLAAKYVNYTINNTLTETTEPIGVKFVSATEKLAKGATGNVIVQVLYNWSDEQNSPSESQTSASIDLSVNYAQDI